MSGSIYQIHLKSEADTEFGEKAGSQHFESFREDRERIVVEENNAKEIKKDSIEKKMNELEPPVKNFEDELNSINHAWSEKEKTLGIITELDLKSQTIKCNSLTLKIVLLILGETLFTAIMIRYALGVTMFHANVFAIVYPSVSAFILKLIFDSLEKRNYAIAILFIPVEIIMLSILGAVGYLNAISQKNTFKDIHPVFLIILFVGLIIVISIVLGYLLWDREKIKSTYMPFIKLNKKRRKIIKELGFLQGKYETLKDQLNGLEDEFLVRIRLRMESYEAGYCKGVMPFKHELEKKYNDLMAEFNQINDKIANSESVCRLKYEERQANYSSGYEHGIAIRLRRQKILNFVLRRQEPQEDK